jgi:hypothetical protein
MEGTKVLAAVTNVFKGADTHDWGLVQSVLAQKVMLDYSSMNGLGPLELSPVEVTNNWETFLPGFDRTHHQLSAFRVQLNGSVADVYYSTVADHFIGDDVWTVTATYHTKLIKEDGTWLVNYHKINFENQTGNANLPKRAHEILAERKASSSL